jgi:hypothetical protein
MKNKTKFREENTNKLLSSSYTNNFQFNVKIIFKIFNLK